MIQKGSRVQIRRAGVGNVRTGAPIRPNDRIRLASVSKALSGGASLRLVSKGRLKLKDTIGKLLPYLPKDWHRVTLAEALHHTSGLPDFTGTEGFLKYFGSHLRGRIAPRKLLAFARKEKLNFKPGTRYRYSNSDNIAVGLMVQAVTGHNYGAELRRLVSRPLRMRRTLLPRGARLRRPFTHGYDVAKDGKRPEDLSQVASMSFVWASGGVASTPLDLNRFIRGYLGGRLFGDKVRARQHDWVLGGSGPPGPGINSAGLALFRYQTRCGTVYGHTGNFPGYTNFTAATPSGRRSVVVTVNTQYNEGQDPDVYRDLRRTWSYAVCAMLSN